MITLNGVEPVPGGVAVAEPADWGEPSAGRRRVCECGCGADLTGRREGVIYANRKCNQRAYRKRLEAR
jgi:hypothetical protein